MQHSIHHRKHIGLGPANIVRGIIFTLVVHLITGTIGGALIFMGFYVIYTICGQLLGLENME
jgi:hypothetical protein